MSTSVEVSPEQLRAIAEGYEMREPDHIRAWLTRYPFLVPILLDMRPEIQRRFPDAPVALQVTDDPEENRSQLLAWIRAWEGDVRSRRERLYEIDDLLYHDNVDITQDKLSFLLGW